MTTMGDMMTEEEVDQMIGEANVDENGMINYEGKGASSDDWYCKLKF